MTDIILTTDDRNAIMRLMRLNGMSDAAIADIWSLSRQRVHELLGPRPPKPEPPPLPDTAGLDERVQHALKAWRSKYGLSRTEAAAALGLASAQTLDAWEKGRKSCALPLMLLRYLEMLEDKTYKIKE